MIEERRANWLMWQRLAVRRKPFTRGYYRAHVHAYAAALLLDFAYRMEAR